MTETWVRLLDLDDLSGPARKVAESGQEQYGQLLHTWRALFHRPEIFAAYLPFLRSVAGPGEVPGRLKDLGALVIAARLGCRYTLSHRATSAARNGVAEAEVVAAVSGDWQDFDAVTTAVLRFAVELTEAPGRLSWAERPTAIDPQLREELSRHFTEAQLVELALSHSAWNALARFHRVMGLELDMPAPPPAIDPAIASPIDPADTELLDAKEQ